MYIYELVGCELDKQNHRHKDRQVGFFATPENIIDYLTKDGKSSCTLSILGHNATGNQYIKEYIGNPDAIIVVKTFAKEIHFQECQPVKTNVIITQESMNLKTIVLSSFQCTTLLTNSSAIPNRKVILTIN